MRSQYQDYPKLNKDALISWLLHSEVCDAKGNVYSWVNPEKPGYIYEEIMGYYVHLMSILYELTRDGVYLDRARLTADALLERSNGRGIERNSIVYTFDTAICLSGLVKLYDVSHDDIILQAIKQFSYRLREMLKNERATSNEAIPKDHWSTAFGASNIKSTTALFRAGTALKNDEMKKESYAVALNLVNKCFNHGAFVMYDGTEEIYTHAHCYAMEGLIFLQQQGYNFKIYIEQGADWLAQQQNEDGSMYNWYNSSRERLKVADATTQSIRIWIASDRNRYDYNIRKAFEFLSSIIHDGALSYHSDSNDLNSWATMFLLETFLYDEELLSTIELL